MIAQYIVYGLSAAVLMLIIAVKIMAARIKSSEVRAQKAKQAEELQKLINEEKLQQSIAVKSASIAQATKQKIEQARIDKGIRDAFDTDTF
jgi:predicted Holliday junction resolvase-like endonuclease